MNYPIVKNLITLSGNLSGKNRSRTDGSVVHETATPRASDENEVAYFNSRVVRASVHAFVDRDSITQTLEWARLCWGAGATANSRFIQVELCHFDGEDFMEVWKRGVWLFAWLHINVIGITTITKDNLMGHNEVSAKWHETDHTDPYGFFADNGKTVDDFRAEVQQEINYQLNGGERDMKINIPDVKVIIDGVPRSDCVLLNVEGRDTTYIPAIALRESGHQVSWDAPTSTVKITTK